MLVCAYSFGVQGQDVSASDTTATFPVSKEVQKFQLRKTTTEPLTLMTGNFTHISKSVQFVNARLYTTYTPVVMKGMPSRVISKGVARMQYERDLKRKPK